ncbi:MAG: lipoprotein [Nitrosomonas sp.]|nr:lipoprotein [Nitrosomonas sp.]
MRSLFIPAVMMLALVLLAACGNKGPLYIPDTETPVVSTMTPTTPPAAATMKDENEK